LGVGLEDFPDQLLRLLLAPLAQAQDGQLPFGFQAVGTGGVSRGDVPEQPSPLAKPPLAQVKVGQGELGLEVFRVSGAEILQHLLPLCGPPPFGEKAGQGRGVGLLVRLQRRLAPQGLLGLVPLFLEEVEAGQLVLDPDVLGGQYLGLVQQGAGELIVFLLLGQAGSGQIEGQGLGIGLQALVQNSRDCLRFLLLGLDGSR